MMNSLFSGEATYAIPVAVTSLKYRDVSAPVLSIVKGPKPVDVNSEPDRPGAAALSAQDLDNLLARARAEATAETEERCRHEHEAKLVESAAQVRRTLELFEVERKEYFSRVEAEVVHLALAISAKILHREAHVDRMLIAALVRVSVDKLHDGSTVTVRIPPAEATKWRDYFASPVNGTVVTVVEDANLGATDCILETDLGSANFNIDKQLKEVEQGFFDLLAQRPQAQ